MTSPRRLACLLSILSLAPTAMAALAAQVPAAVGPDAAMPQLGSRPTLAGEDALPLRASLLRVGWEEGERVLAIAERNATGAVPMQNGLTRALPVTAVSFAPGDVPGLARGKSRPFAGGILAREPRGPAIRWATRIEVEGAWRLRLGLTDVRLPRDAELWVVGGDGETVGPFGRELLAPDGTLWTPSVAGPTLALEVRLPGGDHEIGGEARPGITIANVLELLELDPSGVPLVTPGFTPKGEECQVDAQCVGSSTLPNIDNFQRGVAHLQFVKDGGSFICSGGLLNDSDPSGFIPYFLTANHCFDTQSSASSLEAYFDFHTNSCNGFPPSLGSLPRSNGSTLLGTSERSDFTFVRLAGAPGGRLYFGWTTSRQPVGTEFHRIAHPSGKPQVYSRTRVVNSQFSCSGVPVSDFYYSDEVFSGTAGGSSGGVSFLANGQVVGQLFGVCGTDIDDPCNQSTKDTLDGFFGTSYPSIASYLSGGGGGGGCQANSSTLCLLGRRFEARLTWFNQYNGSSGNGGAVSLTDFSGLFYFNDPSNIELMLKILDFGGGVYKVFYGQLTDLQFTLTIRDIQTGRVKSYSNTPGNCGAIDQNFQSLAGDVISHKASEPELPALPPCSPSSNRLCLLNRRFAIEADWRNQYNNQSGRAITPTTALSNLSGTFSYTDLRNVELLVKTLDFGDRILFIWGTLSDLQYTIRVTDTVTGVTKTYFNPPGQYCGGLDNNFGSGGGGGGGGTTVGESEPNDTTGQAQVLAGSSPIQVNGRAEANDVGQLQIAYTAGNDDVEDLYRVTLRSTGLQVRLSGLSADCDVYIYNNNGNTRIAGSNEAGNANESIDAGGLAPGTYLIGVSIYDPAGSGGGSASNYTLRLDGNF